MMWRRTAPRSLVALGCAVAAGMLLGNGTAGAAPLDFTPHQELEALCGEQRLTLVPLPGKGAFTPYRMSTGQLLVPSEFRLDSAGPGLKTRHLLPGSSDVVGSIAKPAGTTGGDGAETLKCEIEGAISTGLTTEPFTATIVGTVVTKLRR